MVDSERKLVTAFYRRVTLLWAGLFALAVLGFFPDSAQAAETRTPIVEFNGTSDFVTEPFTVDDAWSVEWSTEDERIEIYLKETRSEIPSLVANPVDPGEGRVVYAQNGTFHFEIKAEGPWHIAVYDE